MTTTGLLMIDLDFSLAFDRVSLGGLFLSNTFASMNQETTSFASTFPVLSTKADCEWLCDREELHS